MFYPINLFDKTKTVKTKAIFLIRLIHKLSLVMMAKKRIYRFFKSTNLIFREAIQEDCKWLKTTSIMMIQVKSGNILTLEKDIACKYVCISLSKNIFFTPWRIVLASFFKYV